MDVAMEMTDIITCFGGTI